MAFRYCKYLACGAGLDKPTIEEDLGTDKQVCPKCGLSQSPYMSAGEWSLQIYDEHLKLVKKYEALKETVGRLARRTRFRGDVIGRRT